MAQVPPPPRGTSAGILPLIYLGDLLGLSFLVQETGRMGHFQVPIKPAWACRVWRSESARQVALASGAGGALGWRWWPSAADLPGPDPRMPLDLGNGYGSFPKSAQVLAPNSMLQPGNRAGSLPWVSDPRGNTMPRELCLGRGESGTEHVFKGLCLYALSKQLWHLAQPLSKIPSGRPCCPIAHTLRWGSH